MESNEDMPIQGNLHEVRKNHLYYLKRLHVECESFLPNQVSSLDPLSILRGYAQTMAQSLEVVINHHSADLSDDLVLSFQSWFAGASLLDCYSQFLFASIKLIFSPHTPIFRSKERPNFVLCILNLYSNLVTFRKLLGERFTQLDSLIHSFEYQFFSSYNSANQNILRFDQVHDLLSHSFNIVSPPLIDTTKVTKRDLFRLSVKKLNFDHVLVEIFQFSNGGMAIFKVNSGELSSISNNPEKLLSQLVQGNHNLLDVGRTLLFPLLREYDLEIINLLSSSTVELKTSTGNNVSLRFQCVDPLQWEKHWKSSFKKLFDKNNLIPTTFCSTSSASLTKSSHAYQSFKLKLSKLEDLRPVSNEGLPIKLPSPSIPKKNNNTTKMEENAPLYHQSGLHRSRPLSKQLSALMSEEENSELNPKALSPPRLIESPSLKDIEFLSCDKLIELDKAIKMELSPALSPEPAIQRYKSMSQAPSLEKISFNSERDVEESDLESMISVSETDSEQDCTLFAGSETSTFNPSADKYKPTLYSRRSSSLLSIFSSKSRKEKEGNDSLHGHKVATEGAISSASGSSITVNELNKFNLQNDSEKLPSHFNFDHDEIIFENSQARVSYWNSNEWTRLGQGALDLCILKLENGDLVMVGYTSKDNQLCKFAANISIDWKFHKSAAQDIQIAIPQCAQIVSVIPQKIGMLTVRCREAEKLMNILQHCVKGSLKDSIPKSSTTGTLSSAPSSYMSNILTRSSTAMSGLTDTKNLTEAISTSLLIPSSKVKIHSLINGKGWHVQTIGNADIYSQELKGVTFAIKFNIIPSDKNMISLVSRLHEIQRIGRTGILLSMKDDEKLLEFQNKIIADQVYRLIKPQ